MIVASVTLFNDAPQEQIQLARFAALAPFTVGIIDVLTVTARRDTRNLPVVVLAGIRRNIAYNARRVRQGFGSNESCVVQRGYVDSCDQCHRTEHQGVHISYENPFRLFGYNIRDEGTKEKTYCAVCVGDPTFEIDESWGRRDAVEEELQRYYDRTG